MTSTLRSALFAAVTLTASAISLHAQDVPPVPPGGNPPPRPNRPPPPIIAALDANHDGTLSADEIANAATALKTLDKNGDGQLTPDEMRPPPPPRRGDDAEGQKPRPPRPSGGDQGATSPRPAPPGDGEHASADSDTARHGFADRRERGHRPTPFAATFGRRDEDEDSSHSRAQRPPPLHEDPVAARLMTPNPQASADSAAQHPPRGGRSPLFDALDTNADGVLSTDEINSATASLKKLDKNNTGDITRDELRPSFAPPRER